jgi:predicted MPP superfamily phosphohydrolase
MGLWGTFMLFAMPLDIVHLILSLVHKFGFTGSVDPFRRGFLSQGVSLGLLGASGGIAGLGFLEVGSGPKVKEITVPVEGLPSELNGLRIAQISDLHVGPTIRKEYVQNVVSKVLSLNADLIAVTGDLADGTPTHLESHLLPLANLKAPLGTYYVTGNHEYYWGADQWLKKVTQLGFTPLINENKVVTTRGRKILIGGVTDTSSHQFIPSHQSSPRKAAETKEDCSFKVLLAHRPDSCFAAVSEGFHLQLSGHTHAGQFFPWNLLVRLAHKYYQGLNRHENMWVYVNAGTGYWGPPHRFAVPAEVTLIRLAASV